MKLSDRTAHGIGLVGWGAVSDINLKMTLDGEMKDFLQSPPRFCHQHYLSLPDSEDHSAHLQSCHLLQCLSGHIGITIGVHQQGLGSLQQADVDCID